MPGLLGIFVRNTLKIVGSSQPKLPGPMYIEVNCARLACYLMKYNNALVSAANVILRLANDGRILLSFKPPGFFTSTKYELLKMREIEAREALEETDDESGEESDESDENDHFEGPTTTSNIFDALQDA